MLKISMADPSTAVIDGVSDFNLTHTFMCGQCFRWSETENGEYTGVAFSRAVRMRLDSSTLTIYNTTEDDVNRLWRQYLDLDRDYAAIKQSLSADRYVSEAMKFGGGIHILKQDVFECLISFVISTQNQIPRIKKAVNSLAEMYGDSVYLDGNKMYAFPTPAQLEHLNADDLAYLKIGYRAPYVTDVVKRVCSGEIDLGAVCHMNYADAKAELMKIRGVGPKVADCVLLFSAGKTCAFPVDVWVSRTMRTLYMDESATKSEIEKCADKLFGDYAGFAQQYLFYYARENGGITK